MRKVKLEVESLAVESFSTCPATEARGTVAGHEKVELGRASLDCTVVICTDWDCTA